MIAELEAVNKTLLNEKDRRSLELAGEKGAGSWLTALPLQSMGYTLDKQEFRDAICLRYGWRIPNTTSVCGCWTKNSVDHTLNCKRGSYVNMRHNNRFRGAPTTGCLQRCQDRARASPSWSVGNAKLKRCRESQARCLCGRNLECHGTNVS